MKKFFITYKYIILILFILIFSHISLLILILFLIPIKYQKNANILNIFLKPWF